MKIDCASKADRCHSRSSGLCAVQSSTQLQRLTVAEYGCCRRERRECRRWVAALSRRPETGKDQQRWTSWLAGTDRRWSTCRSVSVGSRRDTGSTHCSCCFAHLLVTCANEFALPVLIQCQTFLTYIYYRSINTRRALLIGQTCSAWHSAKRTISHARPHKCHTWQFENFYLSTYYRLIKLPCWSA